MKHLIHLEANRINHCQKIESEDDLKILKLVLKKIMRSARKHVRSTKTINI